MDLAEKYTITPKCKELNLFIAEGIVAIKPEKQDVVAAFGTSMVNFALAAYPKEPEKVLSLINSFAEEYMKLQKQKEQL